MGAYPKTLSLGIKANETIYLILRHYNPECEGYMFHEQKGDFKGRCLQRGSSLAASRSILAVARVTEAHP